MKSKIIVVCLLVLTLGSIFLYVNSRYQYAMSFPNEEVVFKGLDTNINGQVDEGTLDLTDSEEISAMLQANVDSSYMTYRINMNPVFENGEASGDIMIENMSTNSDLLQVEIVHDTSKETIYLSPVLQPNQSISDAKLDVVLKKGKYKCTAYFRSYNPENNIITGEAGVKILITVLN